MHERARARALKRLPGRWKVWIVRSITVTGPRGMGPCYFVKSGLEIAVYNVV